MAILAAISVTVTSRTAAMVAIGTGAVDGAAGVGVQPSDSMAPIMTITLTMITRTTITIITADIITAIITGKLGGRPRLGPVSFYVPLGEATGS